MDGKSLSDNDIQTLIGRAMKALQNSYAPYSDFYVAAALLCGDGSIYIGNNIENASYSATVCAERTAFFDAVKDGHRDFTAMAVCGGKRGAVTDICAPCGVCRQVMREFCAPDFLILLPKSETEYISYTLEELLPESFGPEQIR